MLEADRRPQGQLGREPGAISLGSHPLDGGEVLGSYQATKALGRWLSFPPKLARKIGIEETVFLLNLMFAASDEEQWVQRSSDELEAETSLSYKQQIRVRNALAALGLLEQKTYRRSHVMLFRVIESAFNELIETLKRDLIQLPFGNTSTAEKEVDINLPKGSSLIKKEEVQEERQEVVLHSILDDGKDWKKIKEENDRIEAAREERRVRKANKAAGNFQRPASRQTTPAKIVSNKQPDSWIWFASLFKRLTDTNAFSHPSIWPLVEEMITEIGMDDAALRLSYFIDSSAKVSSWLAKEFLEGGWRTIDPEDEKMPRIVNDF